jgi:hypothetical protein
MSRWRWLAAEGGLLINGIENLLLVVALVFLA